jgi:hypothetical protein
MLPSPQVLYFGVKALQLFKNSYVLKIILTHFETFQPDVEG